MNFNVRDDFLQKLPLQEPPVAPAAKNDVAPNAKYVADLAAYNIKYVWDVDVEVVYNFVIRPNPSKRSYFENGM